MAQPLFLLRHNAFAGRHSAHVRLSGTRLSEQLELGIKPKLHPKR